MWLGGLDMWLSSFLFFLLNTVVVVLHLLLREVAGLVLEGRGLEVRDVFAIEVKLDPVVIDGVNRTIVLEGLLPDHLDLRLEEFVALVEAVAESCGGERDDTVVADDLITVGAIDLVALVGLEL